MEDNTEFGNRNTIILFFFFFWGGVAASLPTSQGKYNGEFRSSTLNPKPETVSRLRFQPDQPALLIAINGLQSILDRYICIYMYVKAYTKINMYVCIYIYITEICIYIHDEINGIQSTE